MTTYGEPTSVTATEPNFAAVEPTTVAPPKPTYLEEVQKLEQQRRLGAISEYDYNKKKFQILERERFASSGQVAEGGEDVVGTGRYVLSFVMVGFIGLGIAYLLRKQGWLAIWVNVAAMFAVAGIYIAIVG